MSGLQTDLSSVLHPLKFSRGHLNILVSIRLIIPQHEVDDAYHLMSDSHQRLLLVPPLGISIVEPFESSIVETGIMSTLNQKSRYALVPLTHTSDVNPLPRLTDSRRQTRPGGDLLVTAEPVYVSDLS